MTAPRDRSGNAPRARALALRRRLATLGFAAACALVPASHAGAATLERLRAFVKDTQTARTTFTQSVVDRSGRPVQRASGEFLIERPGKFRWSVDKPYRQLVVGDGDRVWIYDEDLNQVVVRRVGEALGSTPAALLSGRDDVERAFTWKEAQAAGGFDWLVATPRAPDAGFAEIRLGFAGRELAALDLVDAFGQRTEIRFGAMVPNAKFPPETFRFVPPKGADVIGEK
jgi:outer membrane lipoprotein carrier protein